MCDTLSGWIDLKTTTVCPPGFHAAPPVRKWVHAPGISPESAEEGGRQEDALPGLHHERMVGLHLCFSFSVRGISFSLLTKHLKMAESWIPQSVWLTTNHICQAVMWNSNSPVTGNANLKGASLVYSGVVRVIASPALLALVYSESWWDRHRANEGAAWTDGT